MKSQKHLFLFLILICVIPTYPLNQDTNERLLGSISIKDPLTDDTCKSIDSFNSTSFTFQAIIKRDPGIIQNSKIVSQNATINRSQVSDYIKTLLPVFLPFFIFFLISLLIWIFYCCCDFGCCCYDQKIFKKNSICSKVIPVIFFLLISLTSIAACIFGIFYSLSITTSFAKFKCGVLLTYFELENGATKFTMYGKSFKGMTKTFLAIKDQVNNLTNASQSSSGPFYDLNNSLCYSIETLENELNNIKNVVTSYSENISGIYGTPQKLDWVSYFDDFYKSPLLVEANATLLITQSIQNNATKLFNSGILSTTNSGLNSFSEIIRTIQDSKYTVITSTNQYETYFIALEFALITYFILISTLLILMNSTNLFYFFFVNGFIKFVNRIGWIILFIGLILGFLFTSVFLSAGLFLQDVCNYINIKNLSSNLQTLLGTKNTQILTECINGDGNFLKSLGITNITTLSANYLQSINDAKHALISNGTFDLPILDNFVISSIQNACGGNDQWEGFNAVSFFLN